MDRQIHGLMLGCVLMLLGPTSFVAATHQLQIIARGASTVTWRDIRVSIVCSEGNPLARVCTH